MLYLAKALRTTLISASGITILASEASAQYYSPISPQSYLHAPAGLGLDLGLQNGSFTPNVGFGLGQIGAGVGAGIDRNGIGQGVNAGFGPLGVTANSGLGRNGLGLSTSAGIGNTGAALQGGISGGGLGLGASTRAFGFGPGASLGLGNRGPGLGASMAFGPLGTLLIGSHRNSYPGAQQTAAHVNPSQNANYYAARSYAGSPYYNASPAQYPQYAPHRPYGVRNCPSHWSC